MIFLLNFLLLQQRIISKAYLKNSTIKLPEFIMKKDTKKPTQIFQIKNNLVKHQKSYDSQYITHEALKNIIDQSYTLYKHNQQLNKFMQQQIIVQSQNFSLTNTDQILNNFYINPSLTSQRIQQQTIIQHPTKPQHSFLNYQQLYSLNKSTVDKKSSLSINRLPWQSRRDSVKIYNCNKLYIVKKSRKDIEHKKQGHQESNKSINVKHNNQFMSKTYFSGERFTHQPGFKKISINQIMMPRLSSRVDLSRMEMNGFHKYQISKQNNNHNQTINIERQKSSRLNLKKFRQKSPRQNRSSFYQQTYPSEPQNKLIKLQTLEPSASLKDEYKQKQTNNHITFLRERKQKLDKIMKVFDLDEKIKKNHKIQRQLLIRDSKVNNLAVTYSSRPDITTDYDGRIINLNSGNKTKNGNSQTKNSDKVIDGSVRKKSILKNLPIYSSNDQAAQSHNVSIKIKDIDDTTKNFLNQIFSSAKATPLKMPKKTNIINPKFLQKKLQTKQNSDKKIKKIKTQFTTFSYMNELNNASKNNQSFIFEQTERKIANTSRMSKQNQDIRDDKKGKHKNKLSKENQILKKKQSQEQDDNNFLYKQKNNNKQKIKKTLTNIEKNQKLRKTQRNLQRLQKQNLIPFQYQNQSKTLQYNQKTNTTQKSLQIDLQGIYKSRSPTPHKPLFQSNLYLLNMRKGSNSRYTTQQIEKKKNANKNKQIIQVSNQNSSNNSMLNQENEKIGQIFDILLSRTVS